MTYKQINNITGWVVFAICMVIYLMTMAPTASFWDCGEFIACANELEVPHPPGAPFFLLIGRVFAILAMGDGTMVAFWLNVMSVLASSFTILLTFWIITYLAKRMLNYKVGDEMGKIIAIMAAGVVGAFCCAFATSFWFNSVEAEVYALSSFFTAVVVWLMFKWDSQADEPGNQKYIILIAYLMGLSIGVHLLNLLTIPALAFIYYYRKYTFSWAGFIATGIVAVAILGIIQSGIILYSFDIAWAFEKFFVGTLHPNGVAKSGLGMPLGTGIVIFFLLLFGGLIYLAYYSHRKNMPTVNTAVLSAIVIYIGFSSYLMIPIRSNANPPIDENNPENTRTFLSYMKREQYGDRPLLYGPLYNSLPVRLEEVGKEYILEEGKDRYTENGKKRRYAYRDSDKKFFPRMYESSRYNPRQFGTHAYANYVTRTGDANTPTDDRPTSGEDFRFFLQYQLGHMYLRYFMWNFTGRENFIQDASWESGLEFGRFKDMPDFMKNDKTRNHYFFLPLIFGLLGIFGQSLRQKNDAAIIGLLFFFTGIAIVIYLNQYPAQPRERDYSFAGSIQTFAIWIGLGVATLYDLLRRYLKGNTGLVVGLTSLIVPFIMGYQNWDDHSRAGRYIAPDSAYNLLNSLAPNAVLFTNGDNDTFPLWYIQEVENVRPDVRVLCLSYVNTDWYIDQMYQKSNESEKLPLTIKKKQYVGQENQSQSMGQRKNFKLRLPVNTASLVDRGIVSERELPFVKSPMEWTVPTRGSSTSRYLELKDVLILNLLENVAKNNWERPVYFANTVTPSSFLGLKDFLRLEGLAYRITPVKNPAPNDPYDPYEGAVDADRMYENLQKFRYRNLNNPDVYYDENVSRMLVNYHSVVYRLSNEYLRRSKAIEASLPAEDEVNLEEVNVDEQKAEAAALKAKALEMMNFAEEKFPYTVVVPDPFIIVRAGIMFDRLGEKEKAKEYFSFAKNRAMETLKYYGKHEGGFKKQNDYMVSLQMLQQHYAQSGEDEALLQLQEEIDQINISVRRR